MEDNTCRDSEPTADRAAALPKADRSITVETVTIILLCSAGTASLCPRSILVPALATEIALLGELYSFGILFGKFKDVRVTLPVIFGHPTQYDIGYLYGNTPVPALWRRWLLSEVGVPHLFYTFVGKRGTAGKQFIATNGEAY